MTDIVLMRHGHALSPGEDPERGLSERGRREVEEVAERLRASGARVEIVIQSGKKRALETARILCARIAPDAPPIHRNGLEPHDDVSDVAEELLSTDVSTAVVGHLPHLEILLARLLGRRPAPSLGTANAAWLRRDGEGWTLAGFYAPEP